MVNIKYIRNLFFLILCVVILFLSIQAIAQSEKNIQIEKKQLSQKDKWSFTNQLYGLTKNDYLVVDKAVEKPPKFYRNIISNSPYMWGINGIGDNESIIFHQGRWILPYLVEQFDNPRKAQPNIFYPPGEDPFNQGFALDGTIGNFAHLYAQAIKDLYINQKLPSSVNDIPKIDYMNQMTPDGKANIHNIQKRWLNEYCSIEAKSYYCRIEHKKIRGCPR